MAQEHVLTSFPADSGNYWIYRIDTNLGTIGTDTMQVIGEHEIESLNYHLFDKYLPLYNLTFETVDSIHIKVTDSQVFIRVDSTDYLWYDFNSEEHDTVEIVIPEFKIEQDDTFKVLTWKEIRNIPIFVPEDYTVHEVTVFCFLQKFGLFGFMAIDYFLPPWGLVSHTFGGVDPVDYNLIEASVNGQQFDRNVVSVEPGPAPTDFRLLQNYPNPFNPETTIEYELAKSTRVKLIIYNLLGQHVKTLRERWQTAGKHSVSWDGTGEEGQTKMPSGLYIYELRVGTHLARRKMLLIR
ncbi:MAG: T9SS type A sorting domain-containing protein [Aliifodinibius sp.]|nr:T9SS type A sorting domain-containing protein [Fodinibius sp.]NIV15592.1 T9SS type A sorting domain-containing protein [Fodinibius sp.]NIY29453.1 T9SS type A sorting domain-containing protein [Fodinibius sp.]